MFVEGRSTLAITPHRWSMLVGQHLLVLVGMYSIVSLHALTHGG